jgi:hypothetical protein
MAIFQGKMMFAFNSYNQYAASVKEFEIVKNFKFKSFLTPVKVA